MLVCYYVIRKGGKGDFYLDEWGNFYKRKIFELFCC